MVVAKYDLGVFVEPDDFEEILKGASKFAPNSATVEMPAKDSGSLHRLKHLLNSANANSPFSSLN
jgi:hypothetical protein